MFEMVSDIVLAELNFYCELTKYESITENKMSGIPNLLSSRAEIETLITLQIQKGNSLWAYEMSKEGLDKAQAKFEAWDDTNKSILQSGIDSAEILEEYSDVKATFFIGKDDIMSRMGDYEDTLRNKTRWLQRLLDERLSLFKDEALPTTPLDDFWSLIHPSITGACRSRFDSQHFADSIETALKYINTFVKDKVKKKTGNEFDGASLMNTAFSLKTPIISLNDLSTESGKNAQLGYMQIFAGAMTGIRNPKAHEIINIDRTRAIHLLFLASLLMYKLDEAL